ncbi:hypothetical protein STAQ_02860 [Allostella sp. ATCC 35155]|nr:hypothetical protein STAQ_02860 [Stella sp. ATCC 35155]
MFSGPTAYDRNAITDAITEETRRSLSPEAAYLLYPEETANEALDDLRNSPDVFGALTDDAAIGVYQYNRRGEINLLGGIRGNPNDQIAVDEIRRQGLTILFRRRGGLLDAGPTAHFVRPSRRASSNFLRAAHALSGGAEIYFAAFWILPYLHASIENIHLDTSSIASVALAAQILNKSTSYPTIHTFHSYDGLKKHPFSVDRADLVLISASQSGSMAKDIASRVADPGRVITLFSSADAPGNTKVICDIRHDPEYNDSGYDPAVEVTAVASTRPIQLFGEHFLVSPQPLRSIVPIKSDAPAVIADTLAKLVGKNVLVALRATGIGDARNSMWVDMVALKEVECFKLWIKRMVNNFVPAATRAVVQVGSDADSAVMAESLINEIRAQGGDLIAVRSLSLDEIEVGQAGWADEGSPVVVTGASAGRGTQWLAASRALRQFAPRSHRIYIMPGLISMSDRAADLLTRNLKQPTFRLEVMFKIIVDRERDAESWISERLLLLALQNEGAPQEVDDRIRSISGEAEGRINGLFLDAPAGALRLRENFAFWPPSVVCSDASHADVFATIATLVENMRTGSVDAGQRLLNDAQTHSVLDPETFSRYNDGIIQAAFLRAALPIELNYRDSPQGSRLMAALMDQMIRYADRQQGEALSEFLLAIACGRLRLVTEDYGALQEVLRPGLPHGTVLGRWLADCIVNRSGELPIG